MGTTATNNTDKTLWLHGVCIIEREMIFKQDTHTYLDSDMQRNRYLNSDKFQRQRILFYQFTILGW